jgi:hypothetical protein
MNLLLAEIQKLAAEQSTIQKQLADQRDLLERRIQEADSFMKKLFEESDTAVERHILDSELRQDVCLSVIKQAASEGVVDDLRLGIDMLNKNWNRSVVEATVEPELILEPPVKSEQHAAPPSAGYTVAWPNGHHVDNNHRENEQGLSPPSLIPQSRVWLIPLEILLSYMVPHMI